MDDHKTDVRFYKIAKNEVLAYFLNENCDNQGNKTSYQHIGQHGACSPEFIKGKRKATPEEYKDLKSELEAIGYNLNII